ncbi:MAG: UvrD-helicase domain-containing protein [Casimicrobiaceae bacterium]
MSDSAKRSGTDASVASDTSARARALDVAQSFLVQAPAGSGKTELLIQRFLALLAHVDRPERIVAMTFTRKAAGEMRERIVRALAEGADEERYPVATPHAVQTRKLAKEALLQDARQGWHLTSHPARLAVQTIDAFCAGLARQAPLATRLGAVPRIEERARPLYESAVREALADAEAGDPDWRRLLDHFDNDASQAVKVLAGMLGKRDQWLRELPRSERAAFRARLEASLSQEIRGELTTIAAAFPPGLVAALPVYQRYAAENAAGAKRVEGIASNLIACAEAGGVPPAVVHALDDWRALATWLLTAKDPQFRKTIDKDGGFPAKASGEGAVLRGERNDGMRTLFRELAAVPGLAEALDAARRLPPPRYADEAWSVVSALLDLLPRLAARLMIVFGDTGALDFTQGTLGALEALGDEDAPSDLLLKLDLRIDHLLIDEFQDTSYTQLVLLHRLTAGWTQGDGRTLFAVGDPMQSIYRFREAEVRIFVEAQERKSVAGVPVECLVLARNFRSHAGLVSWVNDVFPRVLGSRRDPWRGAVAFARATSERPAPGPDAATLDLVADATMEADRVVDRVRDALEGDSKSVAILVRARTHLERILPALREAGILYAAVELDALAERQAILDLAALTHALIQPADRLAWLAVLRAPWCGVTLPDLFALVTAADEHRSRSLAALLEGPAVVAGLSEEGSGRFGRVAQCLRPAVASRGRATLASRVRGAWLALGGGATLDDVIDIDAAERFFTLLGQHDVAGDIPDWPAFVAALDDLRAEAPVDPDVRVQVMTLHRAKGLEFDTVIMPGLARSSRHRDSEVLRLRVREQGLLLAPNKARGGDEDPVYAYLNYLAMDEDRAELGRLLYVGCTRARERLHLTAALDSRVDDEGQPMWRSPGAGTALARLWDALGAHVPPPEQDAAAGIPPVVAPPLLVRLGRGWTAPMPAPGVPVVPMPESPRDALPFDWARETARCIGVVAHRLLAQFGHDGIAAWTDERLAVELPRIRTELAGEGVDDTELERAAAEVVSVLANVIADPRGRWLFASAHDDACSEWALAGIDGGAIAHVVLDRSFVDDGVRWIVDFKTGGHEGADVAAFLDREVERYRDQLQRYALFVSSLDPRPIMLGLYHPLLRGWREWAFAR